MRESQLERAVVTLLSLGVFIVVLFIETEILKMRGYVSLTYFLTLPAINLLYNWSKS